MPGEYTFTYTETISVKINGKLVGSIRTNPGGVYYLPKGQIYDAANTPIYPTLSLCKMAIEAP